MIASIGFASMRAPPREHVEAIEGAKKPETRARHIEATIRIIQRAAKKREAQQALGVAPEA